ncbi:mannose-6-phosphate isomerase [Entomoplasma freundtii]|uniref:Phosphohexomutase n=1 Tax=Entomoplasma freundtii TaxID=74700 RepID=A0A2K8NQZ6_9MOLU|nr:type I phosphomannose isomerase catalytic subunit [Entomoplasma freundtii]ATZ16239.1 mannose-6-phosphate isomerase [Entomoplasma freundtii]TDY56860.1 mannose-6-phosphate isomerase [Entomoplasma freundtii]
MELVKLRPYFSEKIWGGRGLENFGFQLPENKNIGEAWVISAHPNGLSTFVNGSFANQSLADVFENNRHLFGNFEGEFPLLVKILTPNDFLSVQVHPDDTYAQAKHNSLGKPESWYVLEAPENAFLIYGHNAKTKNELTTLIDNKKWEQLLRKVPVKVGDFLYVAPGKIHAVTPGVVVCEIQRSSDITYRLYDYDRLDDSGQPRRLDLADSIACTTVPDSEDVIIKEGKKAIFNNDYFSVYHWNVQAEPTLVLSEKPYWLQLTVLSGNGQINHQNFKKGDSAITLGPIEPLQANGDLKILLSWVNKKN